jgi:hypothetical protein
LTLARLTDDRQAPWPRIEAALADAAAALAEQLDPRTTTASPPADDEPESLALLPERPAAHDVMPWLSRRLRLMVIEAERIREAARGFAG